MKYLNINFAEGIFRHQRLHTRAAIRRSVLFICAGLVCVTWLTSVVYTQTRQRSELEIIEKNLTKRLASQQKPLETKTSKIDSLKIEAINSAIHSLNIPWRDLFDAIEQTTPSEIALVSLEPDAEKRTLKMIAEASNPQSMLNYLEALKKHPLFISIVMTKHEINKEDINSPYRFQFEARWKEASL